MQNTRRSHRRIIVLPYDKGWPDAYSLAAAEVSRVMETNLVAIHHIGSTSIPEIHAKPVIDILAAVSDLAAVDRVAAGMERLGYEVMGEFGIPGRRYFRRDNVAGDRTHQIHTFAEGSPHLHRHLAFRDFMRAYPELANRYSTLKQQLAAAHPHDMDAYMDGKDSFIKEMEKRAIEWASSK